MSTRNPICRHAIRFAICALLPAAAGSALAAPLVVSEIPLFVSSGNKPNVLLTVANSNSMDEDATGLAVGSAAPNSKSEIARRVAKNLVVNYGGGLNMGLAAFQQSGVVLSNLHSSPYDISFNPANYDPTYTGTRDAPTKRFREPNASWPGNYIYYNVNLPFYSGVNEGIAFCYSRTADAFNNGENPVTGPWDSYRCFRTKNSISDTLPATNSVVDDAAQGWSALFGTYSFRSTDSDLGQGITDFGRFMAWRFVSATWFNNGSPGGGFIHVPIANLDAVQANKMNTKLGTSQFVTNAPTNPAFPLQNAGLTPLEGTLFTIRDYFQGNIADAARGGPLPAPPNSCGKNFSVLLTNGLPSVTRFGVPSSDVATMLTAATTAAAAVRAAGVLNYVVGFALPFGVNPAQLDTIAAAGGTGTSYYATDEATLITQLNEVFNDILIRSGAAGAVALNSGYASANSHVYQAKFNTGDWSGQFLSFPVDKITGALGSSDWDSGVQINAQDWDTGRKIITYNPVSRQGVPFRWPANPAAPTASELSAAQVLDLDTSPAAVVDGNGNLRLEYIRGNGANEGSGATNFRKRNVSKLGDIVNSSPMFVGKPSRALLDPSYIAFKATYASRADMLYVGANDGMLHAIQASNGNELLGFVPSVVSPRLSGLTAQGFTHRYLVDGSPNAADIKLAAGWRTLLVSGLGAGGRELFALDVTDPANFSEGTANNIVKWEFTSNDDPDLGLTYSQPTIVKMNNGQPGVIVGNGYNNTGSGRAKLFVLNADNGTVMAAISTVGGSVASPNGLSTPAVIDQDGNGTADYAYAGDLLGNVWKFNLTSSSAGSWNVSFGGNPLFRARDASNNPQPITSAPELSRHPQGGVMVLFGTGKYIETADVTNTSTQSAYGIRDNGAVVANRSVLAQQSVIEVQPASGNSYRAVSNNPIDYVSQSGWYMDLPTSGERVVVDPILRNGRFIFVTAIPSTDPCAVGGYSWVMEVDYLGGGRLNKNVFDVNGDGIINGSDSVSFVQTANASGYRLAGMGSSIAVIEGTGVNSDMETGITNLSSGNVSGFGGPGNPLARRRTSWRQIL